MAHARRTPTEKKSITNARSHRSIVSVPGLTTELSTKRNTRQEWNAHWAVLRAMWAKSFSIYEFAAPDGIRTGNLFLFALPLRSMVCLFFKKNLSLFGNSNAYSRVFFRRLCLHKTTQNKYVGEFEIQQRKYPLFFFFFGPLLVVSATIQESERMNTNY